MRCKDIGRGDLRVLRSGQLSTSPCCRLAVRKGFAPRYPDCHPPGRSLDGDCVKRFLLRYASSVQHRRASSCFELLRASKTRRSSRNPSASRSLCAPSYGLVPFGATRGPRFGPAGTRRGVLLQEVRRGPETSPRACCKKLGEALMAVPLGTNSWLLRSSSFEEVPSKAPRSPSRRSGSRPHGASNLGSRPRVRLASC